MMNQTDLFINQCIVCVCKTKIYYTIINIIKNNYYKILK